MSAREDLQPATNTRRILKKSVLALFGIVAVFVLPYEILVLSMEGYRVFANDPLPRLLHLVLCPGAISPTLPFGVFMALSLCTVLAFLKKPSLVVFPLAGFVAAAWYFVPRIYEERMHQRTMSCANHSGQWHFGIGLYLEERAKADAQSRLPDTAEFDDLLTAMGYDGPPRHRFNLYCPGYRTSDYTTGYVFVGGGLPCRLAFKKGPLIVFCSAECHPPPYDHQHAVDGSGMRHCPRTAEMIAKLQEAIRQAEEGEIPYAADAVAVMRHQLSLRQRLLESSVVEAQ